MTFLRKFLLVHVSCLPYCACRRLSLYLALFLLFANNAYRATREEDPNLHTPRPSFPHGAPSCSRSEIRFPFSFVSARAYWRNLLLC